MKKPSLPEQQLDLDKRKKVIDARQRATERREQMLAAIKKDPSAVEKTAKKEEKAEVKKLVKQGKQVADYVNYEKTKLEQEVHQQQLEEQELARRVLARRSLLAFIMRFEPKYEAGWVHKLICDKLEKFFKDVQDGKSPRLMLFMPPRAGKSLIASHYFPAWALGQDPKLEFISTSYSSQLAETFSRKARGLLKDKSYQSVFRETRLDESTQAVAQWATTKGGGYVAAGVGGGITGKGANVLIIDDPVRNQEDADSYTVREMQKGWYESTAYTRLAPGGGVLIIQTRWHLDDLSGWLEEKSDRGKGDPFEIIRFPAIALEDEEFRGKGDALHPERYPVEALNNIKRAVGPRTWAALYQQNPVPDEGVYFKKPYFRWYDTLPPKDHLRFYSSWDLAVATDEMNDYTAGVIWAVDPDENIYIVDYVRERLNAEQIIDRVITTAVNYGVEVVLLERGQISLAIGPTLHKTIRERKAYSFVVEEMKPGKRDKMLRGRAIQSRMMQGRVFFPESFEKEAAYTEMLQFPSAKHDDFVDALSYAGLYLDEAIPGTLPTTSKSKGWRETVLPRLLNKNRGGNRSSMAS